MKSLTFVEIDIDYCSLVYGTSPCTAAVGVTGTKKCFNTPATCQDPANFAIAPVTLMFAMPATYLAESGIDCIPSMDGVSISPAVVSLGKDLGTRATITANFSDHRWSDTAIGFDKYTADRAYDPFRQGTFWGKFRARQPYLIGRPFRLIRGLLGQSLAEMETRHYIIESFNGPTTEGKYSIVAKDVLKLLDGDRAQAPAVSQGFLTSDIANDATSITLNPAGIGNLEYPASGYAAIGGKEIVSFTRAADVMTITRAQYNTVAVEHDAGDRVQLCLEYSGEDAADIIADLMTNYGEVPSGAIPIDAWKSQTAAYLRRQYSAMIAEPTSVKKLINELIEQAALSIWWDEISQTVKLIVLRQIPDDAGIFDDENILEASLRIQEQPNSRLSQVWTYFAQINPLRSVDDADNYRSIAVTVNVDAETDYGSAAIKKLFSRWIPAGGRAVATRVNDIQLGRFRDAPRKFTFTLFRYGVDRPVIGSGYQIEAWPLQTDEGATDTVPMQFVKVTPDADVFKVEAEELRFIQLDDEDPNNRTIIYDSDIKNVNIRTTHDLLYPTPVDGDEVTVIVEAGATIGSATTATAAMVLGDWPSGVAITVIVRGRIQGRGGNGGRGRHFGTSDPGAAGGPAMYTRYAIDLELDGGEIWGGGGGGGAGGEEGGRGGGGGAGTLGGDGGYGDRTVNSTGDPGTSEAGGNGNGSVGGGDGGGPGLPGNPSHPWTPPTYYALGGAAGAAIDGVSYVTETGTGDILGPEIN